MIELSKVQNYYITCEYTDLRCGIDGLEAVVTQQYSGNLKEESLFLFCGVSVNFISGKNSGSEMILRAGDFLIANFRSTINFDAYG